MMGATAVRLLLAIALLLGQVGAYAHGLVHLDQAAPGSHEGEAPHPPCELCAAYAVATAPPAAPAPLPLAAAAAIPIPSRIADAVSQRAARAHRPRGPPPLT
ncbi:MAG: hypothetical protein KJ025_05435 [Burkholderiales bacterium]|nr:hypothetical protein [Burkholderiales bacterium]